MSYVALENCTDEPAFVRPFIVTTDSFGNPAPRILRSVAPLASGSGWKPPIVGTGLSVDVWSESLRLTSVLRSVSKSSFSLSAALSENIHESS